MINAGVETSFAPVVVTVDSDNNTNISADEIKAAYDSGRSVFLSLGSDYIPLYAAYKNTDANGDGNEAIFRFHVSGTMSADIVVRRNKMIVRDFPYALKLDIPTDDHINGLIEDKMGGEYELIETVTVEEEGIKQIVRNAEPNGNVFNLKKMFVCMNVPIADTPFDTGAMEWVVNDSSGARCYASYSSSISLKSNDRYNLVGSLLCVVDSGICEGRNNFSPSNSLEYSQRNNGPIAKYIGNKSLYRILMEMENGFPIGTEIKIWGVRANA